MAWIENGPVSLPRGGVLTLAVLLIGGAAVAGAGLGFSAAWHGGEQRVAGAIDPNQDIDQAVDAKPLITIGAPPTVPPPVATNATATNSVAAKKANDSDDDDSNDIAAKTAAVQAVQSKPAEKPADIDELLASPSEKPQAPAKPTTDEQAPPAKSDVPF